MEFLDVLLGIESRLGRRRSGEKFADRTIDLDLLLWGDEVINSERLIVPHPQMHLRSFVLGPLCELVGGVVHPVIGRTIEELAERLGGGDFVIDEGRGKLISIAGLIGAGKTTLADALSAKLGCCVIKEQYDTNPFLADVYAGHYELSLDSQLYFLASRVEQLDKSTLRAGQLCISDYVFDKELIYAKVGLDTPKMILYKKIFDYLCDRPAEPILAIFLDIEPSVCLERIHKRNRPFEQNISEKFLSDLQSEYRKLFAGWRKSPLIKISTKDFDASDEAALGELAEQIKYYV